MSIFGSAEQAEKGASDLKLLDFASPVNLVRKDFSDRPGDHSLPTGTVTLLMADIEGSTRIWETRPDEMAAALATMDRTLAELVHANNGVCPIAQGEGDSFVVAFTRPSDAVVCALARPTTGCPVTHPAADWRSHRRNTVAR